MTRTAPHCWDEITDGASRLLIHRRVPVTFGYVGLHFRHETFVILLVWRRIESLYNHYLIRRHLILDFDVWTMRL